MKPARFFTIICTSSLQTTAERQYYQDIYGFDPVTDRISLNELYLVYRYEAWFPLPQDQTLNAAGVEIGAQVDLDCDGLVHNHIVFRHKGKKAIIECTHTVVLSGPAQEVLGLAKDAFLSHNETLKAVALPQWGHFAALKSYVEGIAEVGLSHLLRSSLDAEDMKEATFGFNSIMRRQILAALNEVAARPALALFCDFFMELVDEAPADWLSPRVELLSTLIPLEEGWTYIENLHLNGWILIGKNWNLLDALYCSSGSFLKNFPHQMATLMEEKECITCKTTCPDIHLCNPEVEEQKTTCKYCGAEGITPRHICKDKLSYLSHVCKNCGRVSDNPSNLCYPVAISDVKKAKWLKIPVKGREMTTCQNCHQPIEPPGHICDPTLPYTCKYCGQKVTKSRHMCKEIIDHAKYTCKLCGRIAVEEADLGSAWELK